MFNTIQLITYKIFSETIVASSLLDILLLFRTGSILLFCSFTLTSIHLRIAGTTFKSSPITSPITTTDEQMKIKLFIMLNVFFLSDHNFISNDGNLKIFLGSKDIAEWNKIIMKKNQKSEEEQGQKWKWKFVTFYLRSFGTKILYHSKKFQNRQNGDNMSAPFFLTFLLFSIRWNLFHVSRQ